MNVLLVILSIVQYDYIAVQHNLLIDEWEKRPFMNQGVRTPLLFL